MRTLMLGNGLLLACGMLAWTIGGDNRAEASQKAATPIERAELDKTVYTAFRKVINQGADLYNAGDTNGCYRLYEGALLAVRPLLDHRPDMQRTIDDAVVAAAEEPRQVERAFVLRRAIDQMRAALKPDVAAQPADKSPMPEPKKEPVKQPEPAKTAPKKEEPKKTTPAPAAPKKEEPKKLEPKKLEPKKEEPKKLEKKIEKRAG